MLDVLEQKCLYYYSRKNGLAEQYIEEGSLLLIQQ